MNQIDKFKDEKGEIKRDDIKKIIPYEDPFLFLDKVLKLNKKEVAAELSVRGDEEFFKGHFKGFPIMPGVLIVEGLGQVATMLVRYNLKNHEDKDVLAFKIRGGKFYRPTFPGHKIRFEAKMLFMLKKVAFVNGKVFRGEKLVSKVKMVFAIVDKNKFRGRYSGKK